MIELTVDEFKNGMIYFHVSRQDKEDYKRLNHKPFILKLSDGKEYRLSLVYCPGYYNREFFVRGSNSEMDNVQIMVTFTDFLRIFELVKEYNKTS